MLGSNVYVGLRRFTMMRMGLGPYRGERTKVLVKSGWRDRGLVFLQQDRVGGPAIPARTRFIDATAPSLQLAHGSSVLISVEPLLAAVYVANNWELVVEVTGGEVPALDGSAAPWVDALRKSGLFREGASPHHVVVRERVYLEGDGWSVEVAPADSPTVTVALELDRPGVGSQEVSFDLTQSVLEKEVAPARLFGFRVVEKPESDGDDLFPFDEDVEEHPIFVDERGTIFRGDQKRLLIFNDEGGVENEDGLRFDDEPVRHKVQVLLAYLALLGAPIVARVTSRNAPPGALKQMLRKLEAEGGLEVVSEPV